MELLVSGRVRWKSDKPVKAFSPPCSAYSSTNLQAVIKSCFEYISHV